MTLEKAIKLLEQHNNWRRDDNVPCVIKMVSPTELGKAIDVIIENCNKYKPTKKK